MNNLDKYIIARYMYSIGQEDKMLDDSEYRVLEGLVKEEYPGSEYLQRSWSSDPCPVELLTEHGMEEYIQSIKLLHKSESIDSVNTQQELDDRFSNLNVKGRLSFKEDGFNVVVHYYNGEYVSANLRGRDAVEQMDVTCLELIVPRKINRMGKVRVTGELVIANDKWGLYELETGNRSQRSSVSTAIARGDTDVLNFSAFKIETESNDKDEDSYEVLKSWGFKSPAFVMVRDFKTLLKGIELMSRRRAKYNSPTDGLVLETKDTQIAIRLGAWEEELLMSYIIDYEETRGMHGNSINLLIKPIAIEDRDIRRVTVDNLAFIVEGDLRIGSPVAFTLRSGVIGVYNSVLTQEIKSRYQDEEKFREMINNK